jgi:hypothetical protein
MSSQTKTGRGRGKGGQQGRHHNQPTSTTRTYESSAPASVANQGQSAEPLPPTTAPTRQAWGANASAQAQPIAARSQAVEKADDKCADVPVPIKAVIPPAKKDEQPTVKTTTTALAEVEDSDTEKKLSGLLQLSNL